MNAMFTEDPERRHAIADLDVLRGVVILLVLYTSYLIAYPKWMAVAPPMAHLPELGFLALQLFLAMAGYRLMLDLSHQRTGARYALARALRNLPALWVAVPLALLAARTGGLTVLQAPASAAWANLFMVADVYGVPVADPAFWRLKIELLLAVMAGLAWFAAGPGVFALAVLGGLGLCFLGPAGEPARWHVLTWTGALTLDSYLPQCAFGIALCRLRELPLQYQGQRCAWWAAIALSLVLAARANTPVHAAIVLGAYALAGLAAFGRATWLRSWRLVGTLGRLSYPIYVVHLVPGFVLIHALLALQVPGLAAVLAAAAAACALGLHVHRWIELPAREAVPELLGNVALFSAIAFGRRPGALPPTLQDCDPAGG